MTDSEKLDLLIEKVSGLESDMQTVKGKLDMLQVWQKKTAEHVAELKVSQELFELNTNKRFAKLQDGLETMDEIFKLNGLIPQ